MIREVALEEQTRHSQKMEALGALAGGIAHDFNNLLFIIQSSTEFLSVLLPEGEEGTEDLKAILGATDRASALVQKLLTFSQREMTRPVDLDFGLVVRQLEGLLRSGLPDVVGMEVSIADDLWPTLIDRIRAEQVLSNLVINARDAALGGGEVFVKVFNAELGDNLTTLIEQPAPGRYLCLQVSDTGPGIPEQVRHRIFEPFFTTKGSKGIGLGLATVYGIVKDAGGAIAVDSSGGFGTTFRVFLPASSAIAGHSTEVVPAEVPLGRNELVLVIEDEPGVRVVVTKMLEGGGYRVVSAGGAAEGLDVFQEVAGIRLVLTDVVMPDGSGIELAETIRRSSDVPTLLMSGYSDQLASQQLLGPDESNFLQKPFSAHDLCAKVAAMLTPRDHPRPGTSSRRTTTAVR